MADLTAIFIAILVVLITLVFYAIYKTSKQRRNNVLLAGLCGSGKTLLFSQLIYNEYMQTYTSIKENIGPLVTKKASLNIVDIPGHERLRYTFFELYKNTALGIVFVIDSLTVQKDIRDTAEFLYNVLSDSSVQYNRPRILIACNKQDQPFAKGSTAIRSILEKELNTLRITKTSQLESVDPKSKNNKFLGDSNENFTFSSLNVKVDFVECYLNHKDGSVKIEDVQTWLEKVA